MEGIYRFQIIEYVYGFCAGVLFISLMFGEVGLYVTETFFAVEIGFLEISGLPFILNDGSLQPFPRKLFITSSECFFIFIKSWAYPFYAKLLAVDGIF